MRTQFKGKLHVNFEIKPWIGFRHTISELLILSRRVRGLLEHVSGSYMSLSMSTGNMHLVIL